MTLLESLVALVIVGLTAVGFLELFQGTSRSSRDADVWLQAVAYAESTMESSKIEDPRSVDDAPPPAGLARRIDVRPWPGGHGIDQVTVTVTLPGGGAFVLHRLARAQ